MPVVLYFHAYYRIVLQDGHKMIKRILEQEKAIRQILGSDRKTSHLIPSWHCAGSCQQSTSDFTDILSGENYVTVSSIKPLLHHLTTQVCLPAEEDTQLTKDI